VTPYRTDCCTSQRTRRWCGGLFAGNTGWAMLAIGAGGFVLAGRLRLARWPSLRARAAECWPWWPFNAWRPPRLAPIVHPVTSLRRRWWGKANKNFLRRHRRQPGALISYWCCSTAGLMELLGLMVWPFLIQEGFWRRSCIERCRRAGASPHHGRHGVGGRACFARLA